MVTPPAVGLLRLMFGSLAALWFVALLRPLLVAEGILLLALLVELVAPTRLRQRGGRELFALTDSVGPGSVPGVP